MKLKLAMLLAAMATGPAMAQETEVGSAAGDLALELNALTTSETGCRVSFLATNTLGSELTRSAFEIALFGADGGIERLVSLEFKAMPEGKTRILQFDISGLQCDGLTRVLINDVVTCDGEGLNPKACLDSLTTSSRLDTVEFGV